MSRAPGRDFLVEADEAEKLGDASTAAAKLRSHLALHGDDAAARLRLGRVLLALGELASAREVVQALEGVVDTGLVAATTRLLATLDEAEGALTSAQVRWERALADDIDDPEARAHLRALQPGQDEHWPSNLSLATLVSPEGVQTSRYKLLRELGRGTTAAVYLVRDERLGLPLALKVLHPQFAAGSRSAARERFFAEARLAARLRHPGVVAIYGVDETARCLTMEFIAGGTLRDRLRAPAALEAGEALAIARSLLEALVYVHGAGIVHGDVKPGNILLRRPTAVVLADFGVAQFTAASAALDDRPAGTPLYLAPEQFRGAPPSPGTDLFAAGAILWELVHGRPARRQSDLLAGGGGHGSPPPLQTTLLASLGAAGAQLADVTAALMAADPLARPDAVAARARLA